MAKTLYDNWFVQFDFPDENGKPNKSSGGAMVWNAELKRAIPAGWEVKKMKELVIFEKGIEPGSAEYKNYKVNENYLKFYRVGNIDGDTATFIDASKKKYVFVREHNVLVTFDGSVGKVGFGINGLISSGIRKIHSNFLDDSFIYFLFNDNRIVNIIHQYAKGSIILHASQAIDHLNFVFNEKVITQFSALSQPIFAKMIKNKLQNQTLANLRNWLLPMLMNGQIKVT